MSTVQKGENCGNGDQAEEPTCLETNFVSYVNEKAGRFRSPESDVCALACIPFRQQSRIEQGIISALEPM